ncbi:MAG: ferredoxin [Actinomycetota bacterium]
MRVQIDLDACILAGECIYNHPALFGWDEHDQPVALVPELTADQVGAVEQAISVCPSGAIALVD